MEMVHLMHSEVIPERTEVDLTPQAACYWVAWAAATAMGIDRGILFS